MEVIIIEDEKLAVKKLENLLQSIDPSIQVLTRLESVKDSVTWLKNHHHPDLGLFDIQLSDASSFDIFNEIDITFPVIFITAFEDYLIEAFEFNSIHYILKPITEEKIRKAIEKVRLLKAHYETRSLKELLSGFQQKEDRIRRLVVKKGMDFSPIDAMEVAYIFSEHKMSFVRNRENHTFLIDHSLSELENMLDPDHFFRANRQFIVNISAISKFTSLEQSKIKLDLYPPANVDVIIGKENATKFRRWIKGL
jgi:DNA-binding LytR/AlgR family response regulator